MSIAGNIYGVALNDRQETSLLEPEFLQAPYNAAPRAPIVYMKPRASIAFGPVPVTAGETLVAAPTLALLIARDTTRCSTADALACVGAACLTVDFSLPRPDYYRPAIGANNRNGFLALGEWDTHTFPASIETSINGQPAHIWQLDRLVRDPARLISDLATFMTLQAGDVLLVGLPGDAPRVQAGQTLEVEAAGLPSLRIRLTEVTP